MDTSGLESAPVLLIKNERANPSYNQSTMASPECTANKLYKNRPSGTATLSHPLTQHAATHQPEEADGDSDSLVTHLLDPNNTVSPFTAATLQ